MVHFEPDIYLNPLLTNRFTFDAIGYIQYIVTTPIGPVLTSISQYIGTIFLVLLPLVIAAMSSILLVHPWSSNILVHIIGPSMMIQYYGYNPWIITGHIKMYSWSIFRWIVS